jgi:transposase InsO family protein
MWCARYGIPEMLQSDQGTHFRNEVVKHLCARLKTEQVFTPVYSPWLNGTVERLNKDILCDGSHTHLVL